MISVGELNASTGNLPDCQIVVDGKDSPREASIKCNEISICGTACQTRKSMDKTVNECGTELLNLCMNPNISGGFREGRSRRPPPPFSCPVKKKSQCTHSLVHTLETCLSVCSATALIVQSDRAMGALMRLLLHCGILTHASESICRYFSKAWSGVCMPDSRHGLSLAMMLYTLAV